MLDNRVRAFLGPLAGVAGSIPRAHSLTDNLTKAANKFRGAAVGANAECLSLFGTAAVEMWLRGVHSFLVSSSLTEMSPQWASIAGYYASHYAVRGIAHLLGYYNLRHMKYLVQVHPSATGYEIRFARRRGNQGREHNYYWESVKGYVEFQSNPLFTKNPVDMDISDGEHRNFATYVDHLASFPSIVTLELEKLRDRINRLSNIEFQDPPIPDRTRYPDLTSVQVVAYHRLIVFRKVVDRAVDDKNKFWNVHRRPSWCREVLDFQCNEPKYLEVFG